MPAALLVRFRPAGPWRLGPDNGAKDRTDCVLHSDAVYSALTIAMRDLGWVDDWVAATAEAADPAVRLTSCYPWTGRLLMVEPPRSLWPVAQTGKLRWKTARLIPASLIPALVRGESMKEDQWAVDPVSECLLPVTRNGPMHPPFRVTRRRFATVDRGSGASESAREVACMQFAPSSGMWFAAVFGSDEARDRWTMRLRSACRLLADTGLGGGRSLGWGRSDEPRYESVVDWTRMLTGAAEHEGSSGSESAWWLLSLFSPGASDAVDWKRGNYGICIRAGRMESMARWGELKPATRMVAEGSVLLSSSPLTGTARNVATAEVPHAVYRSGIAVAVAIPWKESRRLPWMTVEPEAAGVVVAAEAVVEELDPLKADPRADSPPPTDSAGLEALVGSDAAGAGESAGEPLVAEPVAGDLADEGTTGTVDAAEPAVEPLVAEPGAGDLAGEDTTEVAEAVEPAVEPLVAEPVAGDLAGEDTTGAGDAAEPAVEPLVAEPVADDSRGEDTTEAADAAEPAVRPLVAEPVADDSRGEDTTDAADAGKAAVEPLVAEPVAGDLAGADTTGVVHAAEPAVEPLVVEPLAGDLAGADTTGGVDAAEPAVEPLVAEPVTGNLPAEDTTGASVAAELAVEPLIGKPVAEDLPAQNTTEAEGAPQQGEAAVVSEKLDARGADLEAESLPHSAASEVDGEVGPLAGEDVMARSELNLDPAAEEPAGPPVEEPTPTETPREEPPSEEPPVTEPGEPEPGPSTPKPDPNREGQSS